MDRSPALHGPAPSSLAPPKQGSNQLLAGSPTRGGNWPNANARGSTATKLGAPLPSCRIQDCWKDFAPAARTNPNYGFSTAADLTVDFLTPRAWQVVARCFGLPFFVVSSPARISSPTRVRIGGIRDVQSPPTLIIPVKGPGSSVLSQPFNPRPTQIFGRQQ